METEMVTGGSTGAPPYWVVTRSEEPGGRYRGRSGSYRDLLTLEGEYGRVLPLFGDEERAAAFAGAFESYEGQYGWRPTQAWAGDLVMLLSAGGSGVGPCSDVGAIAFDPPEEAIAEPARLPETVGKRCFMDRLLGRGDRWWRGR